MEIPHETLISFLNHRQLFKDLEDEDVRKIAERFEILTLGSDEELVIEGERGDRFFIIFSGKVRVTQNRGEKEIELAILETGDKFGEEALLFNRLRSATITTLEKTVFLTMELSNFNWMLRTYPDTKLSLKAIAESHQKARKERFDWLHNEEVIHLISRRHQANLWFDLARPFLALLLAVFFLIITRYIPGLTTVSLIIGGFLVLSSIIYAIWEIIDWQNDYFIITNQRVIWLERVLFQSASRQEAPMSAIQSVNIQTNQIGRILGFGNVSIRTFTGTGSLLLTNVDNPKRFSDNIEELLLRVRIKTEAAKSERMRQSIRQSLGLEENGEKVETAIGILEPDPEPEKRFSLFRSREIDGDTITYHRHWWVLLAKTWVPGSLFLGMLILISYLMYRDYVSVETVYPPISTLILIGAPAIFILLVWLVYNILDWNNDLYRVTIDNIVDREKKPLGQEISKSAPIKNIQSLEHNRDGILRIILNFGTVTINVADTQLTFIDVHKPAQVLQDIFYRQEQLKFNEEESAAERERLRMSEWLNAYHEIWSTEKQPPQIKEQKDENEQPEEKSG